MAVPLWVCAVLVPETLLTCMLLRWFPTKRERWVPGLLMLVVVALALLLRFVARVPWPVTFAVCTGFLWGVVAGLAPFRGWVSSWTLPATGEARLRWRETAWVALGVVAPLSTKRMDSALEKAFAERQVVRARGRFPSVLGVTLLVVPVVCAVGAGWAVDRWGLV